MWCGASHLPSLGTFAKLKPQIRDQKSLTKNSGWSMCGQCNLWNTVLNIHFGEWIFGEGDVHLGKGRGSIPFFRFSKVSRTFKAGKLLDWTIAKSQFSPKLGHDSNVLCESGELCFCTWTTHAGSLKGLWVLSPSKLHSQIRGPNPWMQQVYVHV